MNLRPFLKSVCSRCALCGSQDRIEQHHLGGVNHVPFFTIPLCQPHHKRVTRAIQQMSRQAGGVDLMKYTSDLAERARRARLAALVFLWFLDEIVATEIQSGVKSC